MGATGHTGQKSRGCKGRSALGSRDAFKCVHTDCAGSEEYLLLLRCFMEQKEEADWTLSPNTRRPKAPSVRAEDSRALQDSPQTTQVLKSVLPRHEVAGARPDCSPEYSPDFHKTVSHIRADTFIPLQPFTTARVSYSEKKKLLEKQEEIQEVKQLDEWKPAVDIFKAVLKDLGDAAT